MKRVIVSLLALAGFMVALRSSADSDETPPPRKKSEVKDEMVRPQILWRTNYNDARKEAIEKQRPLVLLFNSKAAGYERFTPFVQDAKIVKILNDQFIPLFLEVEKDEGLREALRIRTWPTIILATPEGKIRAEMDGYADAAKVFEALEKTLKHVPNKETNRK